MAPSQVVVSVNPFNLNISDTNFIIRILNLSFATGILSDSKDVEELIEAYLNSNLVDVNLKIIDQAQGRIILRINIIIKKLSS